MLNKLSVKISNEGLFNTFFYFFYIIKNKINGYLFLLRVPGCEKGALINSGCFVEGAKYIRIGGKFRAGKDLRMQAFPTLNKTSRSPLITIGMNVNFNDYVHIASVENVKIGDNCLFGSKIIITDHNHGSQPVKTPPVERSLLSSPVIVGKNVWICDNVVILPGVTIGDGAIVGANSVVNSDLPGNSIAVGAPAKVIGFL